MGTRFHIPRRAMGAGYAGCFCLLLCVAAHAGDLDNFYVGANFGRELNSYNTGSLDQQFEAEAIASGEGLDIKSRSVHRFVDVWWGDAGYYFTPYVALDAAYFHLGEFRYKTTGRLNVGGTEYATSSSMELTSGGPAVSLLGRLPLTDSFEANLRVGDYIGKTVFYDQFNVLSQSSVVSSSKTTSSLLVGAGAAYTFAGHWSVRIDYLRVNKTGDSSLGGKYSINLATAGVSFTF